MNRLPYHSQNTAFKTQKNKSWVTIKLCMGNLSSLFARNYQYSKITKEVSTSSMMGSISFKINSNWGGCGSEQVHILKKHRPSLRQTEQSVPYNMYRIAYEKHPKITKRNQNIIQERWHGGIHLPHVLTKLLERVKINNYCCDKLLFPL